MKIFKLSQSVNNEYDTFDSIVVIAENEEDARTIHPLGNDFVENTFSSSWVMSIADIQVTYIGEADPSLDRGVVLASFNAG